MENKKKKKSSCASSSRACILCGNKNPNLSYFCIPKNEDTKREWETFCCMTLAKHHRLCQAHFRASKINVFSNGRKVLKEGSIPEIYFDDYQLELLNIPQNEVLDTVDSQVSQIGEVVTIESVDSHSSVADEFANVNSPLSPVNEPKEVNFESQQLPVGEVTAVVSLPISFQKECVTGSQISFNPEAVATATTSLQISSTQAAIATVNLQISRTEQATATVVLKTSQIEESEVTAISQLKTPETEPDQKRLRYPGDIHTPDVSTPKRARISLHILKDDIDSKRKALHYANKKIRRLQGKIETLQDLITHLRENNYISDSIQEFMESLPEYLHLIVSRKNANVGEAYSQKLRAFALTLIFYSPKAYEYVRKCFDGLLPAPSTIRAWYQTIDGSPGFSKESLKAIAARAKKDGCDVVISLVMDEMSIRQQLTYRNNRHYGGVDLGTDMISIEEDNILLAKNVLVFMAVSVNSGWKIPVAYFLIQSLTSTERAHLLNICLQLLNDAHAHVCNITFDGASTNIAMTRYLGANFDYGTAAFKPYFNHPVTEEPVFIIWDVCHMVKLVRNTLGELFELKDENNNPIKWDHICKLYQKEVDEGLKIATKLTDKHIRFHENKMKVKLAVQTLSESVAVALRFLAIREHQTFNNIEGTAQFCLHINNAFDILNVRSKFSYKKLNKPLAEDTVESIKIAAEEIKTYISKLQLNNVNVINSPRKTGFLGLIICLENVFKIYEQLKSKGQQYLLSYKLNQDPLETFFSVIRSKGGFNNNPNAEQFQSAFRAVSVHHEVIASKNGNISIDDVSILSVSSNSKKEEKQNSSSYTDLEIEIFDTEKKLEEFSNELDELQKDDVKMDIVRYISGNISFGLKKKLLNEKKRKEKEKFTTNQNSQVCDKSKTNTKLCETCISFTFTSDNKNNEKSTTGILIEMKDKGSLTKPSEDVLIICSACETLFRKLYLDSSVAKNNIQAVIEKEVSNLYNDILFVNEEHFIEKNEHKYYLIKNLCSAYVKIRLHHESKKAVIPKKYLRQNCTKLIQRSGQ